MLQKCAILGLALLLIGGGVTAWVANKARTEQAQAPAPGAKYSLGPEEYLDKYGRWYQLNPEQQNQLVLELERERQSKAPEELVCEQKARLRADLDKLAARQMDPGNIANDLYGVGWENQVEQYKKLNEQIEFAQITSQVCLYLGGSLFGLCALVWAALLFVRIVRSLRHRSGEDDLKPVSQAQLMDIEPTDAPEIAPVPEERPRSGRRRLAPSGSTAESPSGDFTTQSPIAHEESLSPLVAARARMHRASTVTIPESEEGGVAVLLADEPSQEAEWSPDAQWSGQPGLTVITPAEPKEPQTTTGRTKLSTAKPRQENTSGTETALKAQAETLQKQIAEFKEVAQSVQQATRDQSEPLSSTLKELAQQVSAIREYAACQQDRVEKLQDGYDWGIIRTFCLRVIRCVDNIESRIDNPPQDCADLIYLEEVRDELLFAMESSGIEQFRPDINSEYRGQEKLAEAVKEKQPAPKPDQSGRIAQVLRPGYRYMMDDENYKVVRTAQVKLFG